MSSNPPWHFGGNQKNEKNTGADSAGGVADENLPAAAGDPGLTAGLGGLPPQGSSRARKPRGLSPHTAATWAHVPGVRAPRQDRGEEHAPLTATTKPWATSKAQRNHK